MHNNRGLGCSSIAGAPLAAVYLLGMFIRELKRIPEANDRCGRWYVLKRAQTNVNNHSDLLGMGVTDRWTAGAEGTSRIGIRRDHGT